MHGFWIGAQNFRKQSRGSCFEGFKSPFVLFGSKQMSWDSSNVFILRLELKMSFIKLSGFP